MNSPASMKSGIREGVGFSLDGSGEAESLKDNGGVKPADEIDQTALTESGIVFADSVPHQSA
jgi:hypothetical protein